MRKKMQTKNIIESINLHPTDTGSVPVQVKLCLNHISQLTNHISINPKDICAKRTLTQMVTQRNDLLSYLLRNNATKEVGLKLMKQLNIRFSAILRKVYNAN